MSKHILTKNDLISSSLPVKELGKPFVKKEAIDILYENGFQVCSIEYIEQLQKDSLELAKIKIGMNKNK